MNEEQLNLSVRKFLKQVGITSQRELEKAVRAAELEGSLPDGPLEVRMTLDCPALNLRHEVQGKLDPGE